MPLNTEKTSLTLKHCSEVGYKKIRKEVSGADLVILEGVFHFCLLKNEMSQHAMILISK